MWEEGGGASTAAGKADSELIPLIVIVNDDCDRSSPILEITSYTILISRP